MKLSEGTLNAIYKNNNGFSDFLLAGADAILSDGMDPVMFEIDDLPDQDIIDLVDWWKKKQSEQKYTIKVAPTSLGYFGIDYDEGDAIIDSSKNEFYQTYFTKSEIEQLKQRDDLAIDWNKAKIEPVEEVYDN